MARAAPAQKTAALTAAAAAIRARRAEILAANRIDLADAGQQSLSAALIDRLLLDDKRIEAMADGLDAVAALPDPVGTELARWTPAQRARHRPCQRAAGRHRHHL